MSKKYLLILFFSPFVFCFLLPSSVLAQTAAEEAQEQREFELEERQEELQELRRLEEKPKTAEEVLEMLKKRVEQRKIDQRRKELLKTRGSVTITQVFERNPTSAVGGTEKDDPANERSVNLSWVPRFTNYLRGSLSYTMTDMDYRDNATLNTFDQIFSSDLTFTTLKGKLTITPGASYERMRYPKADGSNFNQNKAYLNTTYYLNPKWSVGGKYEYSQKYYPKDLSRDAVQADRADIKREDSRHTGDLWIKRHIGKYSIRLKGKSYKNDSNDQFQDFYDYQAHKGEITFSGSFLENNKLYMSYTADYEAKHYDDRLAETTARSDRSHSHRLSTNYTLRRNVKLNYSFTFKKASSNAGTGNFENMTNKIGMTFSF